MEQLTIDGSPEAVPDSKGPGFETNVSDMMTALLIDIDSVKEHPKNARKGNVDIIARSVGKFGQTKPIVVQKSTGHIVAGNHLWKAVRKLGWARIAANVVDMDDDTAYQYLLADNKASDLAEYDRQALAANLQELAESGKLQGTLFTADDLDDLMAAVGTLETSFVEFKGDYSDDPTRRAERQQREMTRVAPKMREVPVVITVEQHATFMENLRVLQGAWKTGGAIETILLAVQRAADSIRGADAPATDVQVPQTPADTPPELPLQNAPQTGAEAKPDGGAPVAPAPGAGAVSRGPAPEVTAPPAAPAKDRYDADEKGNLLPSVQAAIWADVAVKLNRVFAAIKSESISKEAAFFAVKQLSPSGGVYTLREGEQVRAYEAIRVALIDEPADEFSLDYLQSLVMRVTKR